MLTPFIPFTYCMLKNQPHRKTKLVAIKDAVYQQATYGSFGSYMFLHVWVFQIPAEALA